MKISVCGGELGQWQDTNLYFMAIKQLLKGPSEWKRKVFIN